MKSQTESLEHASVRQYCKAVRVPVIGANFLFPCGTGGQREPQSHPVSGSVKRWQWNAKSGTATRSVTGFVTRNCRA